MAEGRRDLPLSYAPIRRLNLARRLPNNQWLWQCPAKPLISLEGDRGLEPRLPGHLTNRRARYEIEI